MGAYVLLRNETGGHRMSSLHILILATVYVVSVVWYRYKADIATLRVLEVLEGIKDALDRSSK